MTALLTVPDVAGLLGVHPHWVYKAVNERRLRCVRLGRDIRFTQQQFDDLIAASTV